MSHIFISYSRKDIKFAGMIVQALAENDLETWIDWKSIPKGEDWWEHIQRGIEDADAFLFLISPDSVASKVCNEELNHAVTNGKRIIPIIIRDPETGSVPEVISRLNWIFCRDGTDNFKVAIEQTRETVHTDYEWLQFHRELQVRAIRWAELKDSSRLLRGKDLKEAEELLIEYGGQKEPRPTDLQHQFVLSSQRNEKRQKQRIIEILGFGLFAFTMAITIGLLAVTGLFNRLIYQPLPMDWVEIPAGEFLMGSEMGEPDESPVHTVYLDAFQINTYEVTNKQFLQCVRAGICSETGNQRYFDPQYALHPVNDVTWYDAQAYCKWMGGDLPTEAQWEKAARGGLEGMKYPWGNEEPSCEKDASNGAQSNDFHANCSYLPPYDTVPVGSFMPNNYGLYDMAGNVNEWILDRYIKSYYSKYAPKKWPRNPVSDGIQPERVLRGGNWGGYSHLMRVSSRISNNPDIRASSNGFRCVRPTSP